MTNETALKIFESCINHHSWNGHSDLEGEELRLHLLYNQSTHQSKDTIPPRYQSVTYTDVPLTIQQHIAQIDATNKGIYIHGPVGTGKTHILFAIKRHLDQERQKVISVIDECRGIRFWEELIVDGRYEKSIVNQPLLDKKIELLHQIGPVPRENIVVGMANLLFRVRNSFKDNNDFSEQVINSEKIIMIDDIGVEKVTDWVEEFVYILINTRYEKCLPTIFTSNLKLSELAERIGDRIVSRIREMCHIVKLDGEDRRITTT